MSLDTLAKVDLFCYADGAIRPETLARWIGRQSGHEPLNAEAARLAKVEKIEQIAEKRQWLRSLVTGEDDLTEAMADLARHYIASVVVHVELVVDLPTLLLPGMTAAQLLRALDAGCEVAVTERDDVFLSRAMLVEIPCDYNEEQALSLVEELIREAPPNFRGVVLADDPQGRPLARFAPALQRAAEADLGRVAIVGDRRDAARVQQALELGVQRIVGGTVAVQKDEVLTALRARRVPVVALPTAQVLGNVVRSWQAHPIRKMKEAGLFTVVGSGWPTWLGMTLSEELEQVSRHQHWRLDDLRNLTTRAIEAAFMPPTLRFQLARTVEVWRHRPLVQAQAKSGGDPWSL